MIYFDNAATTPLLPEVIDKMSETMKTTFGNPSSLHAHGRMASKLLRESREQIAQSLHTLPNRIFFTSGGSESNNTVIKGYCLKHQADGKHIITTALEHHAVLESAHWLERRGFEVTYLPVNAEGAVSPESLALALRPDTVLVSVMTANNEVGTVQPIKELTALAHEHNVPFHTDAVQAYAHIPLDVDKLGVDALSVSAHKFHGPKGVGFLYCKRGLKTEPLISGGAQERGYRAGTENLAGIIGMTAAAQLAFGKKGFEPTEAEALFAMETASAHVRTLHNKMQQFICANIPNVQVNNCGNRCLPGILSVSFKGVSGEALLALLDQQGVCASAGSACASGSLEPSHVLTAMGVQHEWLRGTVRFSLSALTTEAEVEKACEILREAVQHLRAVSA